MLFSQNIRTALRGLTANKLRTALTILGIVIGVAAVVALMSIGKGATSDITSRLESSGTNLINIFAGRIRQFGRGLEVSQSRGSLTYDDYEALRTGLRGVIGVAPTVQDMATVKQGNQTIEVGVVGVTSDYFPVHNLTVDIGEPITSGDDAAHRRVAVIGSQTSQDLFQGLSPIGRLIKIRGINFTVIGVLEEQDTAGFDNPNDTVLIPMQTAYSKLLGSRAVENNQFIVNNIVIAASSAEAVDSVMTQADTILRREHGLLPSEEADFAIQSQTQLLSTLTSISTTLTIFLGSIAAISLLVGGIGIMNIMLVSVTERTREIGLRKAVGARKDHILFQFLVETMTLSLIGGMIGILLGAAIAWSVTSLGLITAVISSTSVTLSFGFALAIGLFFGLYPAYRAANLRPMEALRYE
jgi:putative ABC transport system permease protein